MPDGFAQSEALKIYLEEMPLIDFSGLTAGVSRTRDAKPMNHLYDEALVDFARLLEEYRFEVAVGAAYAIGLREELHGLKDRQSELPYSLGLVPKAAALLTPYAAGPRNPMDIFIRPGDQTTYFRILGGWWAAQLFDSAILRGLSTLDRVAGMLFVHSGTAFNPERMPVFRSKELAKIKRWRGDEAWEALRALTQDPIFTLTQNYRDGFVHRQRFASHLHGEFTRLATGADGSLASSAGIDPDTHLAIALAFYNQILAAAVAHAGKLISSERTSEPSANA